MMALERNLLCNNFETIQHQSPSKVVDYNFRIELEETLGLGEYKPFETHYQSAEFMYKLAIMRYFYKKFNQAKNYLERTKSYLKSWTVCVEMHENRKNTFCNDQEFQNLMKKSLKQIKLDIIALESYEPTEFSEFSKVLEYGRLWNRLQQRIFDTFYSYLIKYPSWLAVEPVRREQRNTCAECRLNNVIQPPAPMFMILGGFFIPNDRTMPDGTEIPEGVLVHKLGGVYNEVHEHAHAYIHELKDTTKLHLRCDWIDEGIADWAALNIIKPPTIERSMFFELYDFWIIFNSLKENTRKEIFKSWCFAPERFHWRDFVVDMRECLIKHRENKRERTDWTTDENCGIEDDVKKYFK